MPALSRNWSYESLLDYEWRVEAALLANDDTVLLAAPWTEKIQITRKHRDARDDARQKTARAEARQRLFDAQFDNQVVRISGTAYLAADKQASNEPYRTLFSTITAQEARNLGAAKASTFGKDLVITARKLAHAALLPLLAPFEAIAEKLSRSGEERHVALKEETLHEIDRARLVEQTERLAAHTEIALLKLWVDQPGAKELVRAILSVPRPEKHAAKDHAEDAEA